MIGTLIGATLFFSPFVLGIAWVVITLKNN